MNIHHIFLSLSLLIVPAFMHADATLDRQLFQACKNHNVEQAASLIKQGANVNATMRFEVSAGNVTLTPLAFILAPELYLDFNQMNALTKERAPFLVPFVKLFVESGADCNPLIETEFCTMPLSSELCCHFMGAPRTIDAYKWTLEVIRVIELLAAHAKPNFDELKKMGIHINPFDENMRLMLDPYGMLNQMAQQTKPEIEAFLKKHK